MYCQFNIYFTFIIKVIFIAVIFIPVIFIADYKLIAYKDYKTLVAYKPFGKVSFSISISSRGNLEI